MKSHCQTWKKLFSEYSEDEQRLLFEWAAEHSRVYSPMAAHDAMRGSRVIGVESIGNPETEGLLIYYERESQVYMMTIEIDVKRYYGGYVEVLIIKVSNLTDYINGRKNNDILDRR